MKLIFVTTLYSLAVFTQLSLAQDNSELFSQYIGAPTASAAFDGPSAAYQSSFFTICTNYIHGLPNPVLATSADPQLEQMQVDGVCEFCTSLSQSRVDSCCAVASSVNCFEQFAAQKTPATNPATATTNKATATGVANTAAATTKGSSGNKVDVVSSKKAVSSKVVLRMLMWILTSG